MTKWFSISTQISFAICKMSTRIPEFNLAHSRTFCHRKRLAAPRRAALSGQACSILQ